MNINYRKFPKLKDVKLVAKNKEEFLEPEESIQDWIEGCCKINSDDDEKTMIWGSIKPPAIIFAIGEISKQQGLKKGEMFITDRLLGIGKITKNNSDKTIGWIIRTDSGATYFAKNWTEEEYDSLVFFK